MRQGCIASRRKAATFSEAVQKAKALLSDVVILDLHTIEHSNQHLPAGITILAIPIANNDEAKVMAANIGAAKLLDNMHLAQELTPAILELTPKRVVLR